MRLNDWLAGIRDRFSHRRHAGTRRRGGGRLRKARRRRSLIPAMVETLEDRTLLSGNPLIDGDYTISGLTATIDQAGDDLTLTNESGSVSIGDFLSPSQIIANDWEGGLIGNLYNGWIEWANGTIWFDDPPLAPDTTDYSVNINPGVANTLRDGDAIAFTNELGDVSPGSYLSSTQVIADGWEGGLVGDLVGDSIEWTNGTIWTITIGAGLNDEGAGDPGDPGGGDPGTGEPTFDPDWYTFNTPEDAAVGTTVGTVSYSDPEGQTVTLTLDDGAGGSVPFAIDATGTITVNGPLDYETQDLHTITVTATDPDGNSGFANVDVIVDDVDESPEFDPDYYTFNISEDAITGTPVGSVSYSDPQGHSVTLTIDDGFGGAVPFAIDDIGEITVDGPLDFETQDFYALTVTGTDPDGNIGTAAVDVWIDDVVTEAPIFDPDSYAYGIDEDSAVGTLVGSVTVIEPDGQTYTLTLDDPLGGSVPFAIDTAGDITISTALDYDTQEFYELIATATDSEGNSSTAPVEIYVYESTIPVAFDTTRSTRHDEPLSDSVTYDAIDEDGDPLTFHLDANPTNGNVTFNADGTFTYTPNGSFAGSDSFTWHASDGDNDSNIATLTIDVFNFAPQTYDGWHTTFIDTALNGDLADNAYEQDGDSLTFAEDTAPANGTVTIDPSGTWTYTPSVGFSGEDSFTFTATDGIDTSTAATIHIDVVADYNAGPLVANEDIAITERDTPVVIDVLTNDGSSSGGLNVVAVSTTPTHGTVVINPDNTITYTPNDPLYTGPDSFIYDVQDASSTVTSATVDVYMIRIDLDVNNDGDLDDAVDGVDVYLPGYVGDTVVLSTGDSSGASTYVGQQLTLIVDGLGDGANVEQLQFDLTDVTAYDGYSGNSTDAMVEGKNRNADFSFSDTENNNLFVLTSATTAVEGGQIEPTQSWVSLWAKDYAADAVVLVTIQMKSKQVVIPKMIPTDKDGDQIPDSWEELQVQRWNYVYKTTETVGNTFFDPTDDGELKDRPGRAGTLFDSANANSDIRITNTLLPGTGGKVSVRLVNLEAFSPLKISTLEVGPTTLVTVELKDNFGITSTAAEIVAALNGHGVVNKLVTAKIENGDGSGVVDQFLYTTVLKDAPSYKDDDGDGIVGDSLTVLQEYRGFDVNGGPIAVGGVYHVRLTPAYVDLLVEVDMMKGVPHMPSPSDMSTKVMEPISDAYSEIDVAMWWVIDQKAAPPRKIFRTFGEMETWATGENRNKALSEFVHVMFADSFQDKPSCGGSDKYGSYVFVEKIHSKATNVTDPFDFNMALASTAAHELTHLLLNTSLKNGFTANEHMVNGDPSNPSHEDSDKKFLMYPSATKFNRTEIVFSNATIGQLNFKDKMSVERKN